MSQNQKYIYLYAFKQIANLLIICKNKSNYIWRLLFFYILYNKFDITKFESMHKQKLQSYRKQIRKDYLNDYFHKKRKQIANRQFNQIYNLQNSIKMLDQSLMESSQKKDNQMVIQSQKLTIENLEMIQHFVQTQFGVQCLQKTQLPKLVLPFLNPKHYNRQQQKIATGIFANITFIKPQRLPSNQFLRSITNILENTNEKSFDTIENCLLIIHHLIIQFEEATEFYIKQCQLVDLVYRMFDVPSHFSVLSVLLKIMGTIGRYENKNNNLKQLKKFLKFYLSLIQQVNQISLLHLCLINLKNLLLYYSIAVQKYQNTNAYNSAYNNDFNQQSDIQNINFKYYEERANIQKELLSIQQSIQKSYFLQKMIVYYKNIVEQRRKHFTQQIISVVKMLLNGLSIKTVQQQVIKLLYVIFQENVTKLNKPPQQKPQFNNNQTNKLTSSEILHIQILLYSTIYNILSTFPSQHKILTNHIIYQKLKTRFQLILQQRIITNILPQQQKQIRKTFIYIFGMLSYSGNIDQILTYRLGREIKKYHDIEQNIKESQNFCQQERDEQFQRFVYNLENRNQLII